MSEYFLSKGSHPTAAAGRCAMEWVSYLAGEVHSESPQCVSPVLTTFCIRLNDALPDDKRQRLRPYLARTIGTRGDGLDERRGWLALDWLVRTYTPTWLEAAGLAAGRLRALPPVLNEGVLAQAMGPLNSAGGAARDAAGGDAGGAARYAARGAAGAAAGAAAGDAAWYAAGGVARTAARYAARDAAGDAAAYAAGAAARGALQPTVDVLQESAFGLLDRMLPTEALRLPVAADASAVCGILVT